MEVKIKYNQYEKQIQNIDTYSGLVKAIRQSFKYLLKNKFSIYYFDEDQDKITISNQEDLDAVQELNTIQIVVEECENEGPLSDDSFQKLDKSVQETVNQFRKLSSSINNQDPKVESDSPQKIESPKLKEEKKSKQKEKLVKTEDYEKKKAKIISELEVTIAHLKQEVINIENDDSVKKIEIKLQNLKSPQNSLIPLNKDIQSIQLIKQIDEAESKYLTLNKVEREDLRKNYYLLQREVENIISKRSKQVKEYSDSNKEYLKQKQKYELQIQKLQKRNEKQLKQATKYLQNHETKLQNVINNKCNLEKIEYLNKDQIEQQLDKLTKIEIKEQNKKLKEQKEKKEQKEQKEKNESKEQKEQKLKEQQEQSIISQDSFSDLE